MLWGHKGPRFGIEEAREIPGVFGCPLVGTSVKPKLSLDLSETAAIVVAAVRGRQDMVKDYGTLTDQSFCPLILRLDAVMVALDKMEKETGKKVYIPSMSLPEPLSCWGGGAGNGSLEEADFPPGICKRPQRAGYSFKILGILGRSPIAFSFP